MLRLIAFELKKMLLRRVALATNACVLVLLACIMALNVAQTRTTSSLTEVQTGFAAIEQMRTDREAHAGTLTVERIAADVAAYQQRAYAQVDSDTLLGMSDAAAFDLMVATYGSDEVHALSDPYYSMLLRPWRIMGLEPYQYASRASADALATWYDRVADLTQDALDAGQNGTWTYSDAERAYWTDKQAQVAEPIAYGYAGGWQDIQDCYAFLMFAAMAVCLTLAPTFTNEYTTGTDAVLLSTRFGRSKLIVAKVCAAFLYTTAYFICAAGIVCGVALACFGADGFWLPLQASSLIIPYPLSMGQAALACIGLMYLMTLGMAALTLALSARLRSVLAVFAADTLLFLASYLPVSGNGLLLHLIYLTPSGFQSADTLFSSMTSYPLGTTVVDLIGMLVIVYVLLACICLPAAAVTFRRHRVS